MTWSIVGRDPETGALGIAISTCAPAVGAVCPWVRAEVGAVSTQALTNPLLGPAVLDRLAQGAPADEAAQAALAEDRGRAHRQLHVVDRAGRAFAHTGAACIDWCGHEGRDGVSVAGNMLVGPAVIEDSLSTFLAAEGAAFEARLLIALEAGQAAGGDKRGRQSAALLVYSAEPYADVNLRVDDHPDPVAELRRMFDKFSKEWRRYRPLMPRLANPSGIFDPEARKRFREALEGEKAGRQE